MRSWDKYCEDTEKAIMHLSENIMQPCGMRKPLNRVGDAFGWPKVRYKNLIPWEGVLAEYGVEGLAHNWK